jgi:hypothetical protein
VQNHDPLNRAVVQTYVDVYLCPTDVNINRFDMPESGPASGVEYAPGSYRAVSGATLAQNGNQFFDHANVANGSGAQAQWIGAMHVVRPPVSGDQFGLQQENLAGILDGTSSTLLAAEYHTLTHNRRRTFWAYTYTSYNQSSVQLEKRTLIPDYDKCASMGSADACKRAFASLHPGGVNAVLADGSSHFIATDTIDANIWWALGTIGAGEVIPGNP